MAWGSGPGRDGRVVAVWLPGHECSWIRAPPGRRSQACPYPDSSPEDAHSCPPRAWRCGKSQSPPLRDRSALTAVLNTSAFDGTTIKISPFMWVVRQDARKQTRMLRTSLTPEIKMGLLLGNSPAGKQFLVTWKCKVVPSCFSFRSRDMSQDMRLLICWTRQRVRTDLETWLWASATLLAETGLLSQPKEPRTSLLPRVTRVACCWQQLVRSWVMNSSLTSELAAGSS